MKKINEQKLGDVIKDLLKQYNLQDKLMEVQLVGKWGKVMGKIISRHTTNIYISRKKLFISIDSPVIRAELMYSKERIVTMMNEAMGTEVINEVVIR